MRWPHALVAPFISVMACKVAWRPRPFNSILLAAITIRFAPGASANRVAGPLRLLPARNPRSSLKMPMTSSYGETPTGDALFPAIAMIGEKHGLATRQVTKMACPPILGAERVSAGWAPKRGKASPCTRFNDEVWEELKDSPRPNLVVIAARWSMYAETMTGFAGGRRVFLVDDENKQLDLETSRKVFSHALARTVEAINALGIRVLLIGQPPEFFQDPNVCVVERSISGRDIKDCLRKPRQLVDQRLHASKAILQSVARRRSATTYLSLDSILCDDKVCRTSEGDKPLYEDRDLSQFVGSARHWQGAR